VTAIHLNDRKGYYRVDFIGEYEPQTVNCLLDNTSTQRPASDSRITQQLSELDGCVTGIDPAS
jgi:hypothetical protein